MKLWTVARQAPLSMGLSRQEYWSGLPCPPPRDLPNPGIEPVSLTPPSLAGGFFTTSATGENPLLAESNSNSSAGIGVPPGSAIVASWGSSILSCTFAISPTCCWPFYSGNVSTPSLFKPWACAIPVSRRLVSQLCTRLPPSLFRSLLRYHLPGQTLQWSSTD